MKTFEIRLNINNIIAPITIRAESEKTAIAFFEQLSGKKVTECKEILPEENEEIYEIPEGWKLPSIVEIRETTVQTILHEIELIKNADSRYQMLANYYGASETNSLSWKNNIITYNEFKEYDKKIDEAFEEYYKKAKERFSEAHKRLF